ncbi:sensor domain-containing diguanylate cyclase [Burkholderia gladioli]|uniref:sensor domain-containing diguanylate cyclase n=1 Tax=Burkholderia gladioli TaxID=28095 RepID=UPI000CFED775|nr:sensor domain-containing diguanylate cyclase [Burkholderia gladioli]MBU9273326.1 diguanylate cyclase [Burkholderia gladioli]PRE16022.1 sensor domain-containing diguanylate cyclase [Burkholderia gladioli]
MLITDTGATPVAPAEGLPAQAECGALLRLACAHFGVDAALVVGPSIDGPAALAAEGAWPAALPLDPFAPGPGQDSEPEAMVLMPEAGPACRLVGAADAHRPRLFAACSLRDGHGARLGTLFLLAPARRPLDGSEHAFLLDLAALAGPALARALASAAAAPAEARAAAPPRAGTVDTIDQELVALALNGSGTGIWDRDVASGEIRYSPEWKAILGYAPHELSSRIEDAVDRLHPDDREYVQAEMHAHFEGRTDRYEVEHRILCKDGGYKWICSRGKVIARDGDGRALRMVGATTDITALRETAAHLQQTIDLITNLTDEVDGLVFQYRETAAGDRFFSYASRGIQQIYELEPAQVAGSAAPVEACIDPRDLAAYRHSLRESAALLTPWRLEFRVQLPRQGLRWRHGEARPQRQADGGTLWHGFITDTTERKRIEAELHELATIDHLTELANRRDFLARSEAVFMRLRHTGNGEAAVLMLDLDHFKSLNDRWGHALGDRALRHFAQLLRQEARSTDIIGRIGGEEFAVVLPGLSIDAAIDYGLRLQQRMTKAPLAVGERLVALTVSIGIDRMSAADLGVDQVLTRCDKALYVAKARGRNRIELYTD